MYKKGIPLIVTLVACLIACVVSIIQRVDFGTFFIRFLVVLAIFGFISIVLSVVIHMNFKDKPTEVDEDIVIDEGNSNENDNIVTNDDNDEDYDEDEEDY